VLVIQDSLYQFSSGVVAHLIAPRKLYRFAGCGLKKDPNNQISVIIIFMVMGVLGLIVRFLYNRFEPDLRMT